MTRNNEEIPAQLWFLFSNFAKEQSVSIEDEDD